MLILTITTDIFPKVEYHRFLDNPVSMGDRAAAGLAGAGHLRLDVLHPLRARARWSSRSSEDYVRTARAKGLSNRAVVVRHALRSALVPVATIFGLDFAFLLAGTVFTEKIFGLEGIGKWGLDATYIKDLPVVQATSLVLAVFVVVANIVVDILYSFLDPRVRLS